MSALHRYAGRWKAGAVDALFACDADDVVFHYFGSSDLAGDHVGKEAALTALMTSSPDEVWVLRR